ncbi:MAG: GGDEF domain-containing protein [Phenylobacterium sp.]
MLALKGLNLTLFSFMVTSIAFALALHFQAIWQPHQTNVINGLYALALITFMFAAQFNRSRFSLLTLLWLVFFISKEHVLPWSAWLKTHNDWLILTGCSLFAVLALMKDRGLLSIHSIVRLIIIALCGLGAYGWLWLVQALIEMLKSQLPTEHFIAPFIPYFASLLPIAMPMILTSALLLWQSLRQPSLLLSALLVSFIIWCGQYYATNFELTPLPWLMVLTVLTAGYLLVVIIDAYFLAYRDELTALPSRRALNQLALSLGRKYTVAMADIDHFKKFNDTYGHDIGDQVLKLVAAKLAKVKGGGKVFRYGGEEFTVVFPRKSPEQSIPQLEALRQSIADYKMVVRKPGRQTKLKNKQARKETKDDNMKTVSVTISIGVAKREPKQTFEQALKASDLALYRAKKSGRNKVSE